LRVAGTWLTAPGGPPYDLGVEADDGAELLAAATGQLDEGADLVKLYLDGPDKDTAPIRASPSRNIRRNNSVATAAPRNSPTLRQLICVVIAAPSHRGTVTRPTSRTVTVHVTQRRPR
jgi:hypothetical protein